MTPTPLTLEQRKLVEEGLPMARAAVGQVLSFWPAAARYLEDLRSEARLGVVLAASSWRPDGGRPWPSYAYRGAFLACSHWLRMMESRETSSLDMQVQSEDGDWLLLNEVIAGHEPPPDEQLLHKEVLVAASALPRHQRLALERLMEGRALAEVGNDMGLSRERVRHFEMDALHALRVHFGLPSTPRPTVPTGASEDSIQRLHALLADGMSRTVAEVAQALGYSKVYASRALAAAGATEGPRKRCGRQRVKTWTLAGGACRGADESLEHNP